MQSVGCRTDQGDQAIFRQGDPASSMICLIRGDTILVEGERPTDSKPYAVPIMISGESVCEPGWNGLWSRARKAARRPTTGVINCALLPVPTGTASGQRPVSCCEMTRLRLLLDTSDKKIMATSLKRTAIEWASRSGLGTDTCGLLCRLRSGMPLGDNLVSAEVVIDPVKAFGYVVANIRKGAFSLMKEGLYQRQARPPTYPLQQQAIYFMRSTRKETKSSNRSLTI